MGLQPKINRSVSFLTKKCARCGGVYGPESYAPSKSIFFSDGVIPICADCIDEFITSPSPDDAGNWSRVNKLCQLTDIPFIPKEWQRLYDENPHSAFTVYAKIFTNQEYENLDWQDYFEAFKKLRAEGRIDDELPLLDERRMRERQERWGSNYDSEALDYLDNLYNGLMTTQNVNGALQNDQAIKICKLSYEIDCRIREGADFDKVLGAYDKLVKTAEFTPKNVKNINDFDTVGELIKWLEKKGWRCGYYDGVAKDVVDETIQNIQAFNQRLYVNESGIGEDITHRLEMLRAVASDQTQASQSSYYIDPAQSYDLDNYDNDGYADLIKGQTFNPEAGGE